MLAVLVGRRRARARRARPSVCQTRRRRRAGQHGGTVEDRLYDLGRLAPLATGAGVRVAVIDSGVDAGHPQLRGRVAAGRDFLHGDPDARQDCVGHGTAVASIIAARPVDGYRLPRAGAGRAVVPVRITEQEQIGGEDVGDDGTPAEFAEAIEWAADPGGGDAEVINMSRGDDRRRRAGPPGGRGALPAGWWWSPRPATTARRRGQPDAVPGRVPRGDRGRRGHRGRGRGRRSPSTATTSTWWPPVTG